MRRFTTGDKVEIIDWFDPLEDEFQNYAIRDLARELNRGTVVAFLGSGVSAAYGLQSWAKLTNQVIDTILAALNKLDASKDPHVVTLERIRDFPTSGTDRLPTQMEIAADIYRRYINNLSTAVQREALSLKTIIADTMRITDDNSEDIESQTKPLYTIIEDLRIRRFITTNYDDLITTYFSNKASDYVISKSQEEDSAVNYINNKSAAPPRRPRPPFLRRHLDYERRAELMLFANQVPPVRFGVYHLHGVVDQNEKATDSKIIISTEHEYQELYVRESLDAKLFRESLELVYDTNTVLFIGVGMSEEDLNRILRVYMANRPHRVDREVFLIEATPQEDKKYWKKGSRARADIRRALQQERAHQMIRRYGVRTIFFGDKIFSDEKTKLKSLQAVSSNEAEIENINQKLSTLTTEALVSCLQNIARFRERWWDGWIWKPGVRNVSFSTVSETLEIVKTLDLVNWETTYLRKYRPYSHTTSRHFLTRGGPSWAAEATERQWEKIRGQIKRPLPLPVVPLLPLLLIDGESGSGRGDLIEALIRDSKSVEQLLEIFRGEFDPTGLVWTFVGSTLFSSEFMSVADAISEFLERFANNEHIPDAENPANVKPTKFETWHRRLPAVVRELRSRSNDNLGPKTALIALSGTQRLLDDEGRFASRDLTNFCR